MLAKSEQKITFEEFMKLDSETDQLLEYIDGTIYYQTSPSIKHQRISHKLSFELEFFLREMIVKFSQLQ